MLDGRGIEVLAREFEFLSALGVVDERGVVHCRDCGAEVDREPGPVMRFVCVCGWELHGA